MRPERSPLYTDDTVAASVYFHSDATVNLFAYGERKEMKSMLYSRPQLMGYEAMTAVQSGQMTKGCTCFEPNSNMHEVPAYEADE
jgi:hypothetical protein